jgi:ribose transport system substrate-binding protein
MKTGKRFLCLIAGLLFISAGGFAQQKIVIGISTDAGFSNRKIEVAGIYDRAKGDPNVQVIEQNADNDSTKQIEQIKSMVDQGVTALVVCAVDKNTVQSALDYAAQKNVIVTTYDRFVDHPAVKFFGGYDSYSDGMASGQALKSYDDGKEHVVFELVGALSDTNALARRDGFHKVIDPLKNLKVVQILTDWATDKALSGMENALQKYPNVWAIFCASSHMDGSIGTALKEVGRLKKAGQVGHVLLVSIESGPPGLQMFMDGYTDVYMVIAMDTMGSKIYDAIMDLVNGKTLSDSKYYCRTFPVKWNEFDKRKAEIYEWKYKDLFGK